MSDLSRIKNPDLPFPHVATAPAAARSFVLTSVGCWISLVTTASFVLLVRATARPKLGFTTSQLGLASALINIEY